MAHENSPYADSNVFDDLERDVQDFQCRYNCTILLVGDFNSRTGQMQVFLYNMINIFLMMGVEKFYRICIHCQNLQGNTEPHRI